MNAARADIVLVDTSPRGQPGSMARYGRLIADGLARHAPDCRAAWLRVGLPGAVLRGLPPRLATWAHHGWLATAGRHRVSRAQAPVVHVMDGSYAYVAAGVDAARLVVSCHDLIPHLQMTGALPGTPGRLSRRVVGASLAVVRAARAVVAVSRHTGNDLCAAGVDGARIRVVPPPLDPAFAAAYARRGRAEVRPARILHVGGDGFYKNRQGVVSIFERVRRSAEAELVLAGPAPMAALRRRLDALSCPAAIRLCVDPTDETLQQLYLGAAVLLFPSVYEGFGWPVVEAMACGCPVVCSTAASLPEVGGAAALMAEAADEAALATLCLRVLESRDTAEECRCKGFAQCRQYGLEQTARALREVYAALGGWGG